MSIIKSISGIRGTIGGTSGDNFGPIEALNFSLSFAELIKTKNRDNTKNNKDNNQKIKIVIGRDARPSGKTFKNLIIAGLNSLGIDVIDLDLASTPSVEMAVISLKAQGGIIITASHNPKNWNALKFLNEKGEFISKADGEELLEISKKGNFNYSSEEDFGAILFYEEFEDDHIKKIIESPLIRREEIKSKKFKVFVDGINSVGSRSILKTLEALGLENIISLNDSLDGNFSHNPEPLEENLGEIIERIKKDGADLGVVVDPDVDRLAFIDEKGNMFGEEYTLVFIASYVLDNFEELDLVYPGLYKKISVSNLSSSRALKDISEDKGASYYASAVGELNVVEKMKEVGAVIGGEGSGGVIFPPLHYGRDAMIGLALFLSALALKNKTLSEIKKELPVYFMKKDKITLKKGFSIDEIFSKLKEYYKSEKIIEIDGLKIEGEDYWLHLRSSNTEPIIRLYAEAKTEDILLQKVNEMKDNF